ncbi:MAG: O-antigen ligase family protein [Bacteroidota bacterium]|nr:O-antigen ligase family protein [Bacteroidota bacterium]
MGLLLSCSFYYYVFVHYNYNTIKLFKLYINGALICCYIGLIQTVSFLIKFGPGYNFLWIFNKWNILEGGLVGIRVNSIFSEPSQFAIVVSPLIFLSLYNLLTRKFFLLSKVNCFVVLLSLVLSTSSTGYLGFLISGILIAINYKKILDVFVILGLLSFGVVFLYNNVDDFRSRADAYLNIINKDKLTLDDINSSSFVQYNNFHVATTSFLNHPIGGTGMGSYSFAYEKYSLTKDSDFIIKTGFDFNSQDANSLFLRVLTEMGIIGVLFLLILVFKCFVIKENVGSDNISWLLSSSILVIILLYFFRQGNYFLNGFPFFVWLYYYNWVNFKEYKEKLQND